AADRAARPALRQRHPILLPGPRAGAVEALQAELAAEPLLAQTLAVAQEPIATDQRMPGLDLAGFEHRLQLRHSFDDDADVLVLLGQAVSTARAARIDAATEQHDRFVRVAGGRHIALDRHHFAEWLDAGFLSGFASGHRSLPLLLFSPPHSRPV